MKTQLTEIEKEIKKNGLTLFNYYYTYADPASDLGLFRQLQNLKNCDIKPDLKNERRNEHEF